MIVDDQSVFREMVAAALSEEDDIDVVGQATNGEEALQLTRQLKPDIVLMDINMPKVNGIEATRSIVQDCPTSKVVVLTAFDDDKYVFDLVWAGATGYLLKDTHTDEMIKAIRTAYTGESLIQPRVMSKILREFSRLRTHQEQEQEQASATSDAAMNRYELLTEREREVLRMLGRGMNNKEIGLKLVISEPTVKTHVANLMHKLNCRDRIEAALFAVKNGLI